MANTLPTTMEYFDNLLGEQLTEGGGGESDFSIVFLTISSQKNVYFALKNCIRIMGNVGEKNFVADDYTIAPQDGTKVLYIPLIDGYWECEYEIGAGGTLNVVGNGEANDGLISITGDCTITIS